jgi:hypothetical protein
MNCPRSARAGQATTFSGDLEPSFAGAQVKLRYTRSGAAPIEHTVTTDARGGWTDAATFPRSQTGQWRATATYEGDASHKRSSAECEFSVTALR